MMTPSSPSASTTLDLTALDVLRRNPRYLTRAKSCDTFFSFGPVVVTAGEVPDVDSLEVITEHNGAVCSRDFVRNMRTRPFDLVRFHSDSMTLDPGDLICTGCPKGARIRPGDHVRAHRRHRHTGCQGDPGHKARPQIVRLRLRCSSVSSCGTIPGRAGSTM
jgi:2-keto-4-pentenoate hydratase/2-oxohepta-3-ene-1,7-dioic acid hydratase in catechol pathway